MARVEGANMLPKVVPDVLLGADRAGYGVGRGARRAPRALLSQQLLVFVDPVALSTQDWWL